MLRTVMTLHFKMPVRDDQLFNLVGRFLQLAVIGPHFSWQNFERSMAIWFCIQSNLHHGGSFSLSQMYPGAQLSQDLRNLRLKFQMKSRWLEELEHIFETRNNLAELGSECVYFGAPNQPHFDAMYKMIGSDGATVTVFEQYKFSAKLSTRIVKHVIWDLREALDKAYGQLQSGRAPST